ncbi:MAG: hypothetical protein GY796_25060 [Chloroflexi bacterium]|nr:hypothetical protein [Chloroflexota bacterium]
MAWISALAPRLAAVAATAAVPTAPAVAARRTTLRRDEGLDLVLDFTVGLGRVWFCWDCLRWAALTDGRTRVFLVVLPAGRRETGRDGFLLLDVVFLLLFTLYRLTGLGDFFLLLFTLYRLTGLGDFFLLLFTLYRLTGLEDVFFLLLVFAIYHASYFARDSLKSLTYINWLPNLLFEISFHEII